MLTLCLQIATRYKLLDRISPQLTAFLAGFYEVVPPPLLVVFDFQVGTASLLRILQLFKLHCDGDHAVSIHCETDSYSTMTS